MSTFKLSMRWLVFAALGEWLILRTIARSAIFMPKSPVMITLYSGLNLIGQFAATLSSLLVLGLLAWIVWYHWQRRDNQGFMLIGVGLLTLTLVFLILPSTGWWLAGFYLLLLFALLWLGYRLWQKALDKKVLIPLLALLLGTLYQTAPALYEALGWPGPPSFAQGLFHLGELAVVLSPFCWWYVYGRDVSRRLWMIASFPALAFVAMYLRDPVTAGMITIWSTGLTLYLPWPVYAVSLWVVGVSVLSLLRQSNPVGWAILLIVAGGYVPQLSTQLLLAPLGFWMMVYSAEIIEARSTLRPVYPLRDIGTDYAH